MLVRVKQVMGVYKVFIINQGGGEFVQRGK